MHSAFGRFLASIGLGVACLSAAHANDEYPNRPMTMVVSFAAGGSTDTIARLLAQNVSEILGKSVVVENKPGAEGQLGAQHIAKAAPDGYTFGLVTSGNMSGLPAMRKTPPYDVVKDFTPIVDIGRYAFFLYVNESLPVKTFQEFVDYAKAHPAQMSYGTGNNTGVLAFAQIKRMFDIDLVHVPYKGEPSATTDLVTNRIQAMIGTGAGLPYAEQGKLRTLVALLPERSPLAPDVPVLNEVGMGDLPITLWAGIVGPAGMPDEAVEKLSKAFIAAASKPEVRAIIDKQGFTLTPQPPKALAELIEQQLETHSSLVKNAGIPVI